MLNYWFKYNCEVTCNTSGVCMHARLIAFTGTARVLKAIHPRNKALWALAKAIHPRNKALWALASNDN